MPEGDDEPAVQVTRRLWIARINALVSRGLLIEAMPLMAGVVRLFGPVLDEPQAWVDLTDNNGGVFIAVEILWTDVMGENDSDVEV